MQIFLEEIRYLRASLIASYLFCWCCCPFGDACALHYDHNEEDDVNGHGQDRYSSNGRQSDQTSWTWMINKNSSCGAIIIIMIMIL